MRAGGSEKGIGRQGEAGGREWEGGNGRERGIGKRMRTWR